VAASPNQAATGDTEPAEIMSGNKIPPKQAKGNPKFVGPTQRTEEEQRSLAGGFDRVAIAIQGIERTGLKENLGRSWPSRGQTPEKRGAPG